MISKTSPTTAIFLSGGVDSAVAGYLLKQAGHKLLGVMHYHWPESRCCSTAGCANAEAVAAFLGIPFKSIDVIPEFTRSVVQPYVDAYLQGETPNPCTDCNPRIRFGLTVDKVMQSFPAVKTVATGHYARIQKNGDRYLLLKGSDPTKDQSYMLYALSQTQLERTVFPLGELKKSAVREIARSQNIPAAHSPDSQDVCYATRGHAQFVRDYTRGQGLPPGPIVDDHGKELGAHEGIYQFTIGQRRGLKVALGEAAYVSHIDAHGQTVTLSPREKLYHAHMAVRSVTWSAIESLNQSLRAQVKIRYQSEAAWATLTPAGAHQVHVKFDDAQFAMTPGQRAVFYDGDVVLGGGIIDAIIFGT